tara:strand:- start:15415 stop:16389 length:975 start_codon:yes stop_codon:yes gene_type:complete
MLDLLKTGLGLVLGANKLSILIYHQVLPDYDPMRPDEITAARFDQHLDWIKSAFNVLTLDEAVNALKNRCLPPRSLVITFDDGYENNCSVALPLLEKYGLKATFFIATDFLDGGIMWNDRIIEAMRVYPHNEIDLSWLDMGIRPIETLPERQALAYELLPRIKHLPAEERQEEVDRICSGTDSPGGLMLSSLQVQQLHRSGMEIGGHTCSHPILAKLETSVLEREISANKEILEQLIGEPVRSFAYPNGKPEQDFDRRCLTVVEQLGYAQATTTAWGINTPGEDPYQLRRFTPWSKNKRGFLAQLARNRSNLPVDIRQQQKVPA